VNHTPDEILLKLFGKNKNLLNLVKMQFERTTSASNKAYTDYEKAIAFTIVYNTGRRGYS
jgi:hypothetical protein